MPRRGKTRDRAGDEDTGGGGARPGVAGGSAAVGTGAGAGTGAAAGRVGRRATLPRGRAVVGAFAVAVAVVLVFSAFVSARVRGERAWVVARTALPAGTRLSARDLATTSLGLGSGGAAADAFGSPAALVGRTLAVTVGPGQLVLGSELSPPGTGPHLRPVPVTVPPADVVDLSAGDLVDVLATASSGHGTRLVLRGARVLAIAQPSGGLASSGQGQVVTLGVRSLAEAEAVVAAQHAGTLDLLAGEPSDGQGSGAG